MASQTISKASTFQISPLCTKQKIAMRTVNSMGQSNFVTSMTATSLEILALTKVIWKCLKIHSLIIMAEALEEQAAMIIKTRTTLNLIF
jgi:hypothetical protein